MRSSQSEAWGSEVTNYGHRSYSWRSLDRRALQRVWLKLFPPRLANVNKRNGNSIYPVRRLDRIYDDVVLVRLFL